MNYTPERPIGIGMRSVDAVCDGKGWELSADVRNLAGILAGKVAIMVDT